MSDETADALRARIAALEAALAGAERRAAGFEAMAHEDPMTGILNRRGFAREVQRAIAFNARYDTPVSLIVFDLDGLKTVNDRHGHEAGDAFIEGVARLLADRLRASDVVARIGGDEFAALLWHAEPDVALARGLALQAELDGASVAVACGQASSCVEASSRVEASLRVEVSLRVSVGVAPLTAEGGVEAALARADEALYRDKAARGGARP